MCGRYSLAVSKVKLEEALKIKLENEIQSNYNIAPTHLSHVITNDQPNQLQKFYWGLIPHWSKDGKLNGKLINARSEGIASKPSFRMPIRQKRCLVLADSFYEWKPYGKKKVPYRIMMRNEAPMVMAGIWDIWQQGNQILKSFSILTTPPNEEMKLIHNRMPVIFSKSELWERWLDDISLEEALQMMQPVEDNSLKIYRVSEKLNSVNFSSEDLHHEVLEPPTLFD